MKLHRFFSCAGLAAASLLLSAPVSRAETVYVGDSVGFDPGYVRAFDLATGVATPGFTPISLANPEALATYGNVLYATSFDGSVHAYNATTGAPLAGYTPALFSLNQPYDLAFSGGKLYVADISASEILAFNATTGAPDFSYVSPSGINTPFALAISGSTLYVGDSGNNMVRAFDLTTGVAVPGFTPLALSGLTGLAATDTALYALTVFNTLSAYDAVTGAALPGFTTVTSADGLNNPSALTLYGDNLYVTNVNGGNVTAYNSTTGAVVSGYISPSGFSGYPASIAVSSVPEPGSAVLVLVGAGAALLRRRRPNR